MSSFVLKIIAIISMSIDHVGKALIKETSLFDVFGRCAFPIFAFQTSQSIKHTKNKKRYILRLFLFALISQIFFMMFLSTFSSNIYRLNTLFTLLLGVITITCYEKLMSIKLFDKITKLLIGISFIVVVSVFAEIFMFDYGMFGVLLIFIFYKFSDKKELLLVLYLLLVIIKFIFNGLVLMNILMMMSTLLSVIFVFLYNGKKGKNIKYLFYMYYPVHLLVLYLIFR